MHRSVSAEASSSRTTTGESTCRTVESALRGRASICASATSTRAPSTGESTRSTACAEGHFGVCRDHLDMAKPLDPLGEADPRVVHAREQVSAWQSPFPAWW